MHIIDLEQHYRLKLGSIFFSCFLLFLPFWRNNSCGWIFYMGYLSAAKITQLSDSMSSNTCYVSVPGEFKDRLTCIPSAPWVLFMSTIEDELISYCDLAAHRRPTQLCFRNWWDQPSCFRTLAVPVAIHRGSRIPNHHHDSPDDLVKSL